MALTNAYMLEAAAEGCVAEARLNDVPVASVGTGHARAVAIPVNEQVFNGANRLTLIVNPSSPPPDRWAEPHEAEPPAEAYAAASLVRYPPGAFAGSAAGTPIAVARWTPRAGGRAETFPQSAEAAGTAASQVWPWESGRRLTLDRALADAVARALAAIHAAFDAGDVEAVLERFRPRTRDVCAAYGLDLADRESLYRRLYADMAAEGRGRPLPLAAVPFALRLVGDRRLVECVAVDGRPILRAPPAAADDDPTTFSIFLCALGDGLAVVR